MAFSINFKNTTTAGSGLLQSSGCSVFNKEIHTEIEIKGTPEKVWSVLMEFEEFPNWNPMIRKARGEAVLGRKLEIFVQAEGARGMAFKPTVVKVDLNREFRWLGKVGIRGVFDGEHIFSIEPIDGDTVRFVHREQFGGLMTPLILPFIANDTVRGFNDMNSALKSRVEQMKNK